MSYVEHSTYKDTDTYKFRMDKNTFYLNNQESRGKSCFCIKETKGLNGSDYCYMDGLMDIHSCLGIPGVVSSPHFLHADPSYVDLIEGVKPDAKIHESEMDIEPITGFPTIGYKKAQINLITRPSTIFHEDVPAAKYLPRTVLPMVWIEEGVELNEEYYDILTSSLALITGVNIGQWVFVGVAILLFVVPNIFFLVSRSKAKKQIKPTV